MSALTWWALACLLVVGAAMEGILDSRSAGRIPALAYLTALGLLVAGAGLTVLAASQPQREMAEPSIRNPASVEP